MENRFEVTIKDMDTGAIVKHVKTDCIIGAMYEIKETGNAYSAICLGNASASRVRMCLKSLETLKKSIYEKMPEISMLELASKLLGLDKDLEKPEGKHLQRARGWMGY
jgi:hypothetical protein